MGKIGKTVDLGNMRKLGGLDNLGESSTASRRVRFDSGPGTAAGPLGSGLAGRWSVTECSVMRLTDDCNYMLQLWLWMNDAKKHHRE